MAETDIEERLRNLLSALEEGDASTADLAERFQVSTRTIRYWVQELNSHLGGMARIERKKRMQHLEILDADAFSDLLARRDDVLQSGELPQDSRQRIAYLVSTLVTADSWITIEDLAGRLYVSPRTLSCNLADFEKSIASFGLRLERRPHYGIKVTGSEESRRRCLAHLIASTEAAHELPSQKVLAKNDGPAFSLSEFTERLDRILAAHGIELSSFAYQNILIHICVMVYRVKQGHALRQVPKGITESIGEDELACARDIVASLDALANVELPEGELAYLALQLGSRRSISASAAGEISDEVWQTVTDIISAVAEDFGIDLSDDLELRMNLACHIQPLSLRLRYGMELSNPLLDDMRHECPLAFSMAVGAGRILEDRYGGRLTADEAGYIAMSFALALERHDEGHAKKRILIVCASGMGSARLLESIYRRRFEDCVESVSSCDFKEVADQDFSKIDYVLTTVPLDCELPVPIRRIHFMMSDAEMLGIRQLLEEDVPAKNWRGIISRRRFWPHTNFSTKEEMLAFLCGEAEKESDIPASFSSLVCQREEVVATTFGNSVAMPHPIEAVSSETKIWVALADTPIVWDSQGTEVQAVFLVSFAKNGGRNLEDLFSRLADFFIDEQAMHELIEDQRWETLVKLLGLSAQ